MIRSIFHRTLKTCSKLESNTGVQSVLCRRFNKDISFQAAAERAPLQQVAVDPEVFQGQDADFPCVLRGSTQGPDPIYDKVTTGYNLYDSNKPFHFKLNHGLIPSLQLGFETWGALNKEKTNAVLLFTGMSASSHAKSHENNPTPGWWERFIGPGCALDTDKFFIICINNLGGCYGSVGPSSLNPVTGKHYATTFPVVTIEDIVDSQFHLLDFLGIDKLHAAVGPSLGGMSSLMAAARYPHRVARMVTISSCAQTPPTAIAMRYLQRRCIMSDPLWNNGMYYNRPYPKAGMKLAREIGTLTYRSGPEWEERFGRKLIDSSASIRLCPSFMIENYLEYQGESFSVKYDANSLLYLSKAMDLFDLSEGYNDMTDAMRQIKCPTLVLGVTSDILFPIEQQRKIAKHLQNSGNSAVTYYEIRSLYGHDTFLLDMSGVGTAVKGFLETQLKETGRARERREVSFD